MKSSGNSYFKAISTLMSGSIVAQLFTFLCTPILTRLCTVETLGLYSLVTGAVTIFGMVMSLRYELCIISEKNEDKVYPLVHLSFYTCIVVSIMIFCGYLFYFKAVALVENYILLAIITSLLCLMMGVINIITAYNNRHRQYKLITSTYIIRTAGQNICNLIAGFLSLGAAGLSFSQLIGYALGVRGQIKPLLRHKKELLSVSVSEVRTAMLQNKRQAVISAPATLANGLSYSLINYFIEALFSTAIVGYYSISYRILGLPITIISGNVSRVFMEKASGEYQQNGNFEKTYKMTVGLLMLMAIPIGVVLIIFGPWACEIVFGEGWNVAGTYIRFLTPMFMLRFIAGGVNCSAVIAGKQEYDFVIQLMLTISVIAIFIVATVIEMPVDNFLMLVNAAFSLIYCFYIWLFWRCAKKRNN